MNGRPYHSAANRRAGAARGFTVVEMMFAIGIGSLVLAGVVTSYIFSVKGFSALSNYGEIQADGRRALDWFARDLRNGIAISSAISNKVVVALPKTVSSTAIVTATNLVTHEYKTGAWYRTDGAGVKTMLATNVSRLTFSSYDAAGNVTTQASRVVSVQVDAYLLKRTISKVQSSDFLSARLRMRNTAK